ncbi:hypothetical protein A2U01_0002592 [Trifolium medium]|uniref:Mitochondrial protein n=1 Tax=Trifolium medium TaxID=97028 RepID=A0A392M3B6_9FABA|nr:hypothetical protein [Trifolium medium]
MDKSNAVSSPIVSGTKLSKHDKGDEVNLTQFKQIVGSLMYLTATRPYMMFAVNMIASFMEHPIETHIIRGKTHQDMCSCWDLLLCLGHQESNL